MTEKENQRIENLLNAVRELTPGQITWLENTVRVFRFPHNFEIFQDGLLDSATLENFGDALRIHHSFSVEPFSKDKFEYVLEKVVNFDQHRAQLSSKGNPGHDITIDGVPVSLKTQADKSIKEDKIWISKFMELGKGNWGDDPDDLEMLRARFFSHMKAYDRIFTLRALSKAPDWIYELVEIPKGLLEKAKDGRLEMKSQSKQHPKPGYCYVESDATELFQLYFDGGSERKLQVKNLLKSECIVHARWAFSIPQE
jgi:type II restriction enzyme